ncbi:MAG TPA: hypothetical protein VLZ81_05745 [Blastocatellia bacterium]|nr:hypothetical protein [Blastocatellia bacterium]
MSQASPKPTRVFPCPGCGASLTFDPTDGGLTCRYCGHREAIPPIAGEITENPYEEYLRPRPEQLKQISEHASDVTCSSCGAAITFIGEELSDLCPFCGSAITVQAIQSDPSVFPEALIAFRLSQAQATGFIGEWLKTRWFAPNALKKFASQETISGVYLPFWTYDAATVSDYTGERGEHYWETETYTETDSNGNRVERTRQVQKTRWYSASGRVARDFDDVLVAATRSVEEKHLTKLAPWDLRALALYNPAYLAGFKSQRYQVGLADGFGVAKEIMANVIRGDVRSDIGGDEQRISSVQTNYSDITFKYILLPVYVGAYRFNNKVYQVLVNALTGSVHGDRPYSVRKILLLVLSIIAVLVLAYLYIYTQGQH